MEGRVQHHVSPHELGLKEGGETKGTHPPLVFLEGIGGAILRRDTDLKNAVQGTKPQEESPRPEQAEAGLPLPGRDARCIGAEGCCETWV